MEPGETFLDHGVGSGDIWIGAQVIAEEQGVTLIGPAHLTHMEIGAPLTLRCAEVQLALFFSGGRLSRRQVIAGDVVPEAIAQSRDSSH